MFSSTSAHAAVSIPATAFADADLDDAALALLHELQTRELLTRHCRMCSLFTSGTFYRLGARRLHAVADALDVNHWRLKSLQDALRQLAELAAIHELGVVGAASSQDPRQSSTAAAYFGRAHDVLVVAFHGCLQQHFHGAPSRCTC